KRRRPVAAGAVALILLGIAVGWGLDARRQAGERERLARSFTEQVERIEAMARYSALSPRHDLRDDRAAIRAKMDELDDEIRSAGDAAAGPGHYALGRGYLALDADARAREHLEAAWWLGFREPRAAYALALVLGRLYRQGLLAAERIEQQERREARKREIERQYRDPALAYLAASRRAEVPSAAYVAALVAFYEGRLDEALRHLDELGRALPWFYEAAALRGDILLARALGARNRGERERARLDFEAGRAAYAAAAAIGESVPAIELSRGELEYAAMVMELYGRGDVGPPFQRGIEAAGRALAIAPDHYEALVLRARLQRSLAEHEANQGSDVEARLGQAIADARRAAEGSPARPEAWLELAQIYRQWGAARADRSQDPSEQLRRAVEISEHIAPEDRDAVYHGNLGLVFKVWADHEDEIGADARANRGKAIEAYTRALQLDDKAENLGINLGINYFMRAAQPRAADPEGDLTRALGALEKARAINPRHVVPFFYEGEIYKLRARRARARGGDPGPDLARSVDRYRSGLAISPRLPHLHNGLGNVLIDQAAEAWDRGADPDPLLDQARAAFEQAIAAAPEQGFGHANVGEVLTRRARFQRARGEDPSANLRAAVDALKRALERIPDQPTFWANLGTAHALKAAYELEQGRDPEPSLARAAAAIRTALEKNPKEAQAQLYLAETRGLRARWRARRGGDGDEDFEAAARAFQAAIDQAPEQAEYQLALGHFDRAWAAARRATGRSPAPPLERGLALADRLLATRPTWPDARLLRADLLLEQAQASARADERRALGAKAAEDLAAALAGQPALAGPWRSQAALARRLAAAPP
ncbi:MAG TPA: hypothetical protein VN253_21650, partial [Kofleriaceae bacterium]|nr:hypothetical protein [Kofleriaceae bacterium]